MNSYQNMDVELFDYRRDDQGCARFRVYTPVTGQPRQQAEEVVLRPELRGELQRLENRELTWDELIGLGKELAALLFPPGVRLLVMQKLQDLVGDQGLRIRIKTENYALADLPWEYVYLLADDPPSAEDLGFLTLNPLISLVRNEAPKQPRENVFPLDNDLRIVTLLADPETADYPPLGLTAEINKIREMLNRMERRPYIRLYPNTTRQVLEDIVDDERPHVLHFAGYSRFEGDLCVAYGTHPEQGAVVLQDAVPFSAEGLAINLIGRGIRLVMLGACAAGRHKQVNAWTCIAPALTQAARIPAVVGLQYTIDHESILAFCRRFYRSLNAGKPIDAAVTDGRLAIWNLVDRPDDRDWGVPVVYLRTMDPVLFPRRGQEEPGGIQGARASIDTTQRRAVSVTTQSNNGSADVRTMPSSGAGENVDQTALRKAMVGGFTMPELEILCADIEQDLRNAGSPDPQVNLGMVGGTGQEDIVLNLITYLERRDQLSYLISAVRRARPNLPF